MDESPQPQSVAMNEALLLGALRQHELTEAAGKLNEQLRAEITLREKGVAELLLSDRRFTFLAEAMPQKIFTASASGEVVYFNALWMEFTGLTSDQIKGWGWTQFIHPDDVEENVRRWRHSIATGEPFEFQHRFRRADGTYRWHLSRAFPMREPDGSVSMWVGSNTDIHAVKQADDALRASEERFRVLFDSGPVAIFSCDREAVLQAYNRRAAELWGREVKCGDGGARHCGSLRLYHADGRPLPHEESPIIEVLRTGVIVQDAEVFIERPDGSRIAVSVTFAPLKNEKGDVTGAITAFHDISARRLLEDSLVARAEELARADRSKDEFLAMLAHELRNPLAPLRNAAEILQAADATDDERREAQRILARQIENMTRLVEDLLDISRITEGKIDLRRQPVALAEVLTAAANVARSGIATRRQELGIALPAEPIFLNADATRLEQVFGNLLANACKYSDPGCHISLSAERAAPVGHEPPTVIVRVRDDGIGIAPELLPRIFDLFVQATHAISRSHGGLGIGLTLVQRLVKLHGGTVEARSEGLGKGSEFIVRLPILAAPPTAPASPAPAAREAPRRMLIVDDNEDSTRSMAILQRRRGHETRTAFTGPDAVAAAVEFLPEVVLLDIGLPGMDGYEVARRLRAMPALAGIFLVAMSGYGSDEDRAQAKLAGFDEHLVKPVNHDLLREWLRSRD